VSLQAQPALINGAVGAVWAPGGRPRINFDLPFQGDRISAITIRADAARLAALTVTLLAAPPG
jgi:RNA polymerase sigma-70 factor (ECF subfamily)